MGAEVSVEGECNKSTKHRVHMILYPLTMSIKLSELVAQLFFSLSLSLRPIIIRYSDSTYLHLPFLTVQTPNECRKLAQEK